MTFFRAITLLQQQDFDENFGGPPEGYYDHGHGLGLFDPYVLGGLVVMGVVLGILMAAAWYIGRQRARRGLLDSRKASADYIYKSVKYLLDKALKSSGGMILERGREVADMLESRLGFVLALDAKPGKMVEEIRKSIKGDKPKPVVTPPVAKVKVALPTEAHLVGVWNALQDLSVFWANEAEVKQLIEAAQIELSTRPPREAKDSADLWPWQQRAPEKKSKVEAIVAGALNDADKAGSAPVIAPAPAATEPPPPETPPPPPPAPAPTGGKKPLPAHKRNMLA